MNITICKQSASRTVVEQATDVSPSFKLAKGSLNTIEDPHKDSNCVVCELEKI